MVELKQLLKFKPILKQKIWGGEKLIKLLGKSSNLKNIGESWEISDVEESISMVLNGALKGKSLQELIKTYKEDLVGKSVYQRFGNKFPLLIKFIDAKLPLSIQLHPNDNLAKKRHNSFGKTEMWYVVQADKNANLIVGFKKDTDKKEYLYHLQNKTLLQILNIDEVTQGDVYFIPAGRIHAIGAGVLLAEIQQTSDITYRVYDWERKDTNGNYRELHTKEALDAIGYTAKKSYKTQYKTIQNDAVEVLSCSYFTTNKISITPKTVLKVNHTYKDSFVIYMCVEGLASISIKNQTENLQFGETLLVPACIDYLTISSTVVTKLLEVYIK